MFVDRTKARLMSSDPEDDPEKTMERMLALLAQADNLLAAEQARLRKIVETSPNPIKRKAAADRLAEWEQLDLLLLRAQLKKREEILAMELPPDSPNHAALEECKRRLKENNPAEAFLRNETEVKKHPPN